MGAAVKRRFGIFFDMRILTLIQNLPGEQAASLYRVSCEPKLDFIQGCVTKKYRPPVSLIVHISHSFKLLTMFGKDRMFVRFDTYI